MLRAGWLIEVMLVLGLSLLLGIGLKAEVAGGPDLLTTFVNTPVLPLRTPTPTGPAGPGVVVAVTPVELCDPLDPTPCPTPTVESQMPVGAERRGVRGCLAGVLPVGLVAAAGAGGFILKRRRDHFLG